MLRGLKKSQTPLTHIDARAQLLDLLREQYAPEPDAMLMICPYGIGDIYLACGLVSHVLKARHRRTLSVLCGSRQTFIPPTFNKSYRATSIPEWVDIRLLKEAGPLPENFLYAHFQNQEVVNLIGYKGVTLLDAYRALLNLPLDIAFQHPQLISAQDRHHVQHFFEEHQLDPKKTVVLAPEAVSVGEFDIKLWQTLAASLREKGLNILLNSEKYRQAISHDASVAALGLERVPAVAEVIHSFVALRSGLCDLLSGVDCRQIILYPDVAWHGGTMFEATSLKAMGLSKTAHEIVVKDSASAIKQILKVL